MHFCWTIVLSSRPQHSHWAEGYNTTNGATKLDPSQQASVISQFGAFWGQALLASPKSVPVLLSAVVADPVLQALRGGVGISNPLRSV